MIFSSIDTLHVIYYNYTMKKIFKHLDLPTENISGMYEIGDDGFCKNIKNRGYTFEFKLNYNNIWLHGDCSTVDVDTLKPDNFFTFEFKKIRVEITGEGMEFLRSRHFSPDDTFIKQSFWLACNTRYNITRVDFAFDYVNDKKDTFDAIFTYVDNYQLANRCCGRLLTGRGSGISFKRKYGNEDTLYLGSTGSDKICRIYDKKLERGSDRIAKLDIPSFMLNDIKEVKSWYRVELQFRRFYCEEQLFGNRGDLKNNLMFLFDNFMICDKDERGDYHHIQPMVDLYDWTKLQKLYKMQNESKFKDSVTWIDKVRQFMKQQGALSNTYGVMHGGLGFILDNVELCLAQCQDDPMYYSRLTTLNSRIRADADFYGYSLREWLPFVNEEKGQFVLDKPKIVRDLLMSLSLERGVREVVFFVAEEFKQMEDNLQNKDIFPLIPSK